MNTQVHWVSIYLSIYLPIYIFIYLFIYYKLILGSFLFVSLILHCSAVKIRINKYALVPQEDQMVPESWSWPKCHRLSPRLKKSIRNHNQKINLIVNLIPVYWVTDNIKQL